MAPYKRRRYYNNYRRRWKRYPYRRRRFRTTFPKYRRRRRVRRRFFKHKVKRKLKKLRLNQWQPNSIKKCHIRGYLQLFQGGDGRQENNFTLYKDSYTPENEPGGGTWSLQKLTLGTLYELNNDIQNWWTKSNYRLNLCRYIKCKLYLYRQPFTDYVFHYFWDMPQNVTKYYYASFHPQKLLQLQHKVIVPSFYSHPHKKKPYITIKVGPPKLLKNQWFFQQHFANQTLLYFAASAISLPNMFGSDKQINNNASFFSLNTDFFTIPCFQFRKPYKPHFGYHPNPNNYYWAVSHAQEPFNANQRKQAIYLGNSMENVAGFPALGTTSTSDGAWGNPFHFSYLQGDQVTFITTATQDPAEFMKTDKMNETLQPSMQKNTPNVFSIRYNPYKDKGKGNKVYFIPNFQETHTTWEPTSDPDLMLQDFPIWIMLWGIEGIMKKMGKCPNLYEDWILVIQSKYFSSPEKYFVPLSWNFVHGQGPYDIDREHITPYQNTHWYPKYKFQKEAVHDLIMTAPAVCRADHSKNIQALMKYDFFFKWGGNPSPIENVYDPNSQPITPTLSGQQLQNEITNPATDIQTFIYPWDIRRDFLTKAATERITKSTIDDNYLFTDGIQSSTDVQIFPQETQTKTTQKEKETTLLFQLQQLQQFNRQLQLRFNQLNLSLMDL